MSGVYGDINSRADFQGTLNSCIEQAWGFLRDQPNDPTHVNLISQLDAMKRWTEAGRNPSQDERKRIDVGLIAVREFEPPDSPEIYRYAQALQALNNYFEDWPTDEQAASASEDDFFED